MRCMISFGDDVSMPKCTYLCWESSCYPCKDPTARAWQQDGLSPMYMNSSFLALDNFDMEGFLDDISHDKDQNIFEGINNMNY